MNNIASQTWVKKLLSNIQNSITPMGTVISYMGTTAPDGYLICDGTTYNISDYTKFANFIKEQFGSVNYFGGDGTTTFAVPDLRGEFLRGTGTNSHTNQGSGVNVGNHQDATENSYIWVNSNGTSYTSLPDTRHGSNVSTVDKIDKDIIVSNVSGANQRYQYSWSSTSTANGTTSKSWSTSYTSRPTNTAVLYCIKYQ